MKSISFTIIIFICLSTKVMSQEFELGREKTDIFRLLQSQNKSTVTWGIDENGIVTLKDSTAETKRLWYFDDNNVCDMFYLEARDQTDKMRIAMKEEEIKTKMTKVKSSNTYCNDLYCLKFGAINSEVFTVRAYMLAKK